MKCGYSLQVFYVGAVIILHERFDSERSPENRLYLDCFCVVASGIGVSGCG